MRNAYALIPIFLVLIISGCTIPGLGGLFSGGSVTQYENDVIVVKELSANPSSVRAGQTITVYADVENILKAGTKNSNGIIAPKVTIELYDYCPNIFELDGSTTAKQPEKQFQPLQISTFSWKLKALPNNLQTSCDLKIRASYSLLTDAITSISFIEKGEFERKMREGESFLTSGSTTIGAGPLKPYLTVVDKQPIIAGTPATLTFQLKNTGAGFVKESKISGSNIKNKLVEGSSNLAFDPPAKDCAANLPKEGKHVVLIRGESSPSTCEVKLTISLQEFIESTYSIKSSVKYEYEFRKEIKVTVNPK